MLYQRGPAFDSASFLALGLLHLRHAAMSMWKIPLLLSVAYGFQRVLQPPNIVKKEGHKRFTDLWTKDFIAWGQFGGKVGPYVRLFSPPHTAFESPACQAIRVLHSGPHYTTDPTIL